jgi:imidazole glycerol phosphate synthase subunit HisF
MFAAQRFPQGPAVQVRIIVCLLLFTMFVVVDTVSATPLRQLEDGVDLATFFAICGAAVLVQIGIAFTWERR